MIDTERFDELLREAMGNLSQKDFAEKAGLSKFTLNKYLTRGIKAVPRMATLKGIADASEGRVLLSDLMHSVGIHAEVEEKNLPAALDIPEEVKKAANDLAKGIGDYIGKPAKDESVESLLDIISRLYLDQQTHFVTGKEVEFVFHPPMSGKFCGAECMVPVKAVRTDLDSSFQYSMPFILMYCHTAGTENNPAGVIITDAVFDLATLSLLERDLDESDYDSGIIEMLDAVSEVENAKMTDFPVCVVKSRIR
jgi:transcriptional regulator with XRE-family HTH domain